MTTLQWIGVVLGLLVVGTRLPAWCTSLGRVLLAGLDDAEVKARLKASDIRANTRHTATDVGELLARVQQVRRQGWALVNQELEEGLISIAAPVKNRAGAVVAALNVSGQANRTSAAVMKASPAAMPSEPPMKAKSCTMTTEVRPPILPKAASMQSSRSTFRRSFFS